MGWKFVRASPAPILWGLVMGYRGFRDDAPPRSVQREPASPHASLILDIGSGWRVTTPATEQGERLGAFAVGIHDRSALVEAAGPALCVQVDLSPFGARRLFGVPMHELVDRAVSIEHVLGRTGSELTERLAEMQDWPGRFACIDAELERRLDGAPVVSPEVEWAWRQLVNTSGALPIGELIDELGWSRKRLVARFRDGIGLAPKTAARLLRFEALRARLQAGHASISWARLATACGFFDQAHLIRDVHEFAGMTPTELLASLTPGRHA